MRTPTRAACASAAWLAAGALLLACAAPRAPEPKAPPALRIEPARIARDVAWLADDAREGRGIGTPGIAAAAEYLSQGFREAGLEPGGSGGSFLQRFEMPVEIRVARASLSLRGSPFARDTDFEPFLSSGDGDASGESVFAGYGISAPKLGYDDYDGLDVAGRIVLVLDDRPTGEQSPLHGPHAAELLRRAHKIANARAHGAVAVLIAPAGPTARGEPLPGDAGRGWANPTQQASALPVISVSWQAASEIVAAAGGEPLAARKARIDRNGRPASAPLPGAELALSVVVERRRALEANVVAILEGADPVLKREAVVVGAHFDHLGRGEFGSLAPDRRGEIHNGADDNASGAAGLLELARAFAEQPRPRRSLVLAAFSGEETGLAGSREYTSAPPIPMASTAAMVNLDMIGRLGKRPLVIFGTETSPDFPRLAQAAADGEGLAVTLGQGAFSPSDQTSFLAQGVPVLFFFTGTHESYHTPDDDFDAIDSQGEARVLRVVYGAVRELLDADTRPEVIAAPQPTVGGGQPGYGPYLGTIPDFAGPPGEGLPIQGVRKGSPAEVAGLRAGDRILEFDGVKVANLEEYAALLFAARVGQRVVIVVERDGERIVLEATLGQRR